MASRPGAAPRDLAQAARTIFILVPLFIVVGALLVALGVGIQDVVPMVLGGGVYLGAGIAGLVGVYRMIDAIEHLLARHHEATALMIRHYRVSAAAGAQKVAAGPQRAGGTTTTQRSSPAQASAADYVPFPAPGGGAEFPHVTGAEQNVSAEARAFIALLNTFDILDATRNIRRVYGKEVCASFVNRKCADNGIADVNLTAEDIPAEF